MRLLVLGGTHHVGRAVVEEALARGDLVTTVTRGVSGAPSPGAEARYADRTDLGQLAAVLGDDTWDAVIDTWSSAPKVVRDAAALLADRAGHYGYVSSRSVYQWPIPAHADESAPVVDADAASEDGSDYAAAKMGGELATLEFFDGRSVLARAGLILGPYEIVGRMPWWLRRIERGGDVLAPGPRDLPLQYIDGRDLARWMLHAADEGISGAFNAVSEPGHATMESLLNAAIAATGSDAHLVWVSPEAIEQAGLGEWVELPIWASPIGEAASLHDGDVSAIYAAGLVCRPVTETVADTWRWLQAEGDPPVREGRPAHGLDPDREREVLAGLSRG
ncbi:MAG TPA: NAD-dependent epimerase/dehydratase family protein [Streptosporangiaceae bacterium]|jgi:nucleoside-diphosphate-sugar epimerase|nr:NAD-dependent epimerase/dehydratase family protein [Streptosporangiaceae bacterium]